MSSVITVGAYNAGRIFSEIFPDCGVVCAAGVQRIVSKDSVVIFGTDCMEFPAELCVPAAVISADSEAAAAALSGSGIPVITCGMSQKNTVSITSRTPDSITLSLNRSITTTHGVCEPLEFPVKTKNGAEPYDYMAAFAAGLILGNRISV